MPERDGLGVIAQLRARTHPWLKLLAYSGGGSLRDFDVLTLAKQIGAHAALQKPFSVSDLLSAVEELLRRPT
jgi:DNA-binding response OmpR family regulator